MHKTAGATGNLRFPWRLLCHKGLSVFCHISLRFFFLLLSVISLVLPDLPCAAKDSGLPELRFDEVDIRRPLPSKRVRFDGFMAPPLKADAKFFVLTREPVSLCPFCSSDADWPDNIIVVFLKEKQRFVQLNTGITVTGVLETGSQVDEETGFVSQLRLRNAEFHMSGE